MPEEIKDENNLEDNIKLAQSSEPEAYLLKILKDAQQEKKRLEEQKIATLNILEDMSESQEELRIKYQEVKIIKELVQRIGTSFDPMEIITNIAKSVLGALPDMKIACVNFLSFGPNNVKTVMFFSDGGIGVDYMAAVKNSLFEFIGTQKTLLADEWTMKEWKNYSNIEAKIVMGIAEITPSLPVNSVNIPINIEGLISGFFNFSSPHNSISDREISFFSELLDSAAQTVVHLRQLVFSEHSRLRDLIQSMTNGVLRFDSDWLITAVNPIFLKMVAKLDVGYNLKEFLEYFTEQQRAATTKELDLKYCIEKTLKSGRPTFIDEVYFNKSVFQVSVVPVHDYVGRVTGGAIILHDITHIKEIDQLKTEFVSVASHQLRTPLTAIKLFVEMLLGDDVGPLNADQRDYLTNIQESSLRMIRLVNNLLNVSRIETDRLKIEPEDTDIVAFVTQAIDEIISLAELKKCKIKFNKPKLDIKILSIDQTLMHQVFHNLLTNAINYSKPSGGNIIIEMSETHEDVIISVKDDGIGIPLIAQKKIFQKFFRADNAAKASTEGSGLGMYVVKMIIEASGGRIWFESQENVGTAFYVAIKKTGMRRKEGEKALVA
ncbi:MAG: ATP-binding protein [Candidatus Falkowbacteria bacterium]